MKKLILLLLIVPSLCSFADICDVKKGSTTYGLEFNCVVDDTLYEVYTHLDQDKNLACLKEVSKRGNVIVSFRPTRPVDGDDGVYFDFAEKSFLKLPINDGGMIYQITKNTDRPCDTQYPIKKRSH